MKYTIDKYMEKLENERKIIEDRLERAKLVSANFAEFEKLASEIMPNFEFKVTLNRSNLEKIEIEDWEMESYDPLEDFEEVDKEILASRNFLLSKVMI